MYVDGSCGHISLTGISCQIKELQYFIKAYPKPLIGFIKHSNDSGKSIIPQQWNKI